MNLYFVLGIYLFGPQVLFALNETAENPNVMVTAMSIELLCAHPEYQEVLFS